MLTHSKGELAKEILLILAGGTLAIGLTFIFVAFPGFVHIAKVFNAKTGKDNFRLRQSVQSLERHGFVSIVKKHGVETIVITPLGKREANRYALEQIRPQKTKVWDKKWRIVMFDIPEKKKKARDALRNAFKKMDFIQIQKSVFVYPYPCKKEIDFIAEYFQIRKGITYAVAGTIEGGGVLKKKFKLK